MDLGDDDDVQVDTLEDEDSIHAGHDPMDGPQNQTPEGLTYYFSMVVTFVQSYGWILLILGVALYFLKQRLEDYLRRKRVRDADGLHARDPDAVLQLQLNREDRIRRLQEEQDAAAERERERQREKEERLRQEKLEDWERYQAGGGYKPKSRHRVVMEEQNGAVASSVDSLNASASSAPKPSSTRRSNLRGNDFSPMMGSGGSSGYRPSPRGGFGGSSGG